MMPVLQIKRTLKKGSGHSCAPLAVQVWAPPVRK